MVDLCGASQHSVFRSCELMTGSDLSRISKGEGGCGVTVECIIPAFPVLQGLNLAALLASELDRFLLRPGEAGCRLAHCLLPFELWVYHSSARDPNLTPSRDTGTVKGPENVASRGSTGIQYSESHHHLFWQGGLGEEAVSVQDAVTPLVTSFIANDVDSMGWVGGGEGVETKPQFRSSYFPAQGLPPPPPPLSPSCLKKFFFPQTLLAFLPSRFLVLLCI